MRLYLQLYISILGIIVNLSQSSPNRCSSDEGGNNDTIKIQPEVGGTTAIIECGINHAYNIIWYRFNETIKTSSIYKPPCNGRGNPRLRDKGQELVIDYARPCHTAIYTCVANNSDVIAHSTDLRVVANPVHKPNLLNDSDSRTPSVAIAEDVALTYLFDEGQGSEEEGVMFQWWVQTEHGLVFLSNDTSLLNFTTSSFYISQKQWLDDRQRRFASTTLHITNVESAAVTNYTLLACNEYGDDSFIITLQLTPMDDGLQKTLLLSLSFLVLLSLALFTIVYKFRVDIQLYLINRQTNDEDFKRDPDVEGLQRWDVFISHSGSDSDWQFVFQTLRGYLEQNGYSVCLAERDFIPGTNTQEEYVGHLSRSLRTIVVISSDYLQSPHCNFEISAALDMFQERKTKIISLIYNDISSKDIHKFHPKLASVLRVLPVVRWTDSHGSNNVEDICKRLNACLPPPSRSTIDGDKPIDIQI